MLRLCFTVGNFCFRPILKPVDSESRPNHTTISSIHSRKICPGGVGFETSSAKGDMGAVLVSNSTLPVSHGVSVLLIGNRLGLQIRKPDDKQVNANGEIFCTATFFGKLFDAQI